MRRAFYFAKTYREPALVLDSTQRGGVFRLPLNVCQPVAAGYLEAAFSFAAAFMDFWTLLTMSLKALEPGFHS